MGYNVSEMVDGFLLQVPQEKQGTHRVGVIVASGSPVLELKDLDDTPLVHCLGPMKVLGLRPTSGHAE